MLFTASWRYFYTLYTGNKTVTFGFFKLILSSYYKLLFKPFPEFIYQISNIIICTNNISLTYLSLNLYNNVIPGNPVLIEITL